jgi:ribosomal 50S subunit-associated protein YjgA (DUF615 family)
VDEARAGWLDRLIETVERTIDDLRMGDQHAHRQLVEDLERLRKRLVDQRARARASSGSQPPPAPTGK